MYVLHEQICGNPTLLTKDTLKLNIFVSFLR